MIDFTHKLIIWYEENRRSLPWRKTSDAYKIWLSEIIMQQTRVGQGMPYYLKFIETFPLVNDLANADEKQVLKLWEGLGYYSRARNLHKTAQIIVEQYNSKFPDSYNELLKLKGIGPYTAAAIASIVFNEPVVAIDGNVLRVASRLFLIKEPVDKLSTVKTIRSVLQDLIKKEDPGNFNQAMMELGAMICTPKKPKCNVCPVSVHCLGFANGLHDKLPIKSGKVKVKQEHFNYLIPDLKGKTEIIKRKSGIWTGLYQFPLIISNDRLLNHIEIVTKIKEMGYGTIFNLIESPIIKHVLTHKKINACFWSFETNLINIDKASIIIEKSDLEKYPMPQLLVNFIKNI